MQRFWKIFPHNYDAHWDEIHDWFWTLDAKEDDVAIVKLLNDPLRSYARFTFKPTTYEDGSDAGLQFVEDEYSGSEHMAAPFKFYECQSRW